jgi:hypothetical protein
MSVDSIYNTNLYENYDYGIYIDSPLGGSDWSYVLYDTLDDPTSPNNQAAIMVRNHDRVKLYKLKVRNYENSITCYNCDKTSIGNCDLSISNYAIYSQQYSCPIIRQCALSTYSVGIKTDTHGTADVGHSSDSGLCSFSIPPAGKNYYIYRAPNAPTAIDSLWAQYNWYGTSSPSSEKFYSGPGLKVIWSPYLTSAPPAPRLDPGISLPLAFSLGPNYPNPFNPQTTIRFTLDASSYTTVTIYNILGQQVNTLVSEQMQPGEHTLVWNGRDSRGKPVSSGIYFYTIQAGERFESRKMVMMR